MDFEFDLRAGIAAVVASWLLWRTAIVAVLVAVLLFFITKRAFTRHALSNIRGPAKPSRLIGHFGEMFGPQAMRFHRQVAEQFGSVVKVYGMFGSQHLQVCDPLALHHILVKDQYIYEETDTFIQ
ncbi:hypothetical protein HWV62_7485 [Athelia sp. TMB]|nr:hypothetical protein HWV62_7485 [Athelia sp. TMB]